MQRAGRHGDPPRRAADREACEGAAAEQGVNKKRRRDGAVSFAFDVIAIAVLRDFDHFWPRWIMERTSVSFSGRLWGAGCTRIIPGAGG